MADLAVTASRVNVVCPQNAETFSGIATEAIAPGQIVYQLATGKYGVAAANVAGKQQARGYALRGAAAGEGFGALKRGIAAGFTVPQAADAQLFLSNTPGGVGDAAGLMAVPIGRVVVSPDSPDLTKLVYFDFDWITQRA